jgi:hypothetical protein
MPLCLISQQRKQAVPNKKKVGIMFFFNKCIECWIKRSASFMGSTDSCLQFSHKTTIASDNSLIFESYSLLQKSMCTKIGESQIS